MDYRPITDDDKRAMLTAIGVKKIEELFSDIPNQALLRRKLAIPEGISEIEAKRLLESVSNRNCWMCTSFLGAGSYNHFIPAVVRHLVMRSEFYTAYTPYQPEISQGMLQAIFEYQTMICSLFGMDVANASMYDGASALAEAMLMAAHVTGRR